MILEYSFGVNPIKSLNNLQPSEINKHAEGILLYPTVKQDYDHTYQMGNHKVRLVTVDLSKPWKEIDQKLRQIVQTRP